MSSVTFDFVCTKNTDYDFLHKCVDSYIASYKYKYIQNPNMKKQFTIIIE